MATIRRAGFGTVFELEDSKVGIGTDAATHTLQALGNIRSEGVQDVGITTLTTYQGFTDKEARFGQVTTDKSQQLGTLSDEIVIDEETTVSSATTFTSGPQHLTVTDTFTLPSGDTNSRELKPTVGSLRFNQDLATLEFYTGNNWATVNTFTEMQNSPGNRGRAVFGGGDSNQDIIDYFNITTQGNAISFGEIKGGTSRQRSDACSSATRGLIIAGFSPSAETDIDYITLSSEGNSIKFGDVTDGGGYMPACLSSSTRGIKAGGSVAPANLNTIQYVEINTLGDGIDFGDLTTTNTRFAGCSSPVKGLFGGGYNQGSTGPAFERVDEITIASKGNAVSFRNLDRKADALCSSSNHVTGIWAGGTGKGSGAVYNAISFISIASGGDAIHFGDLMRETNQAGATGSQTRALIAGGGNPTVPETVFIEYSSLGNAMDFGELTAERRFVGGMSDSHGGLGGF